MHPSDMVPWADKVRQLRELGVEHASFHPDGSLASVELGPDPSLQSSATGKVEEPDDNKPVAPRRSPTAGLIPRSAAQPDVK